VIQAKVLLSCLIDVVAFDFQPTIIRQFSCIECFAAWSDERALLAVARASHFYRVEVEDASEELFPPSLVLEIMTKVHLDEGSP
jgi:hypothetical protein